MKLSIVIFIFFFAGMLNANDKVNIHASTKSQFNFTKSGFKKSKSISDYWNIIVNGNSYFLLVGKKSIALETIKEDENIIVLKQPVLFSGYRIFTFFKKSLKFSVNETSYVSLSEMDRKNGHISEIITISYGEYKIK